MMLSIFLIFFFSFNAVNSKNIPVLPFQLHFLNPFNDISEVMGLNSYPKKSGFNYESTILQNGFHPSSSQVLIFGPQGQGQPFLLNPGSPPGNFLIPQQPGSGPNFVFGGNDPQQPVFIAGYPKPAHIPPIEKDAEEIPTVPGKITPHQEANPQKLQESKEFYSGLENFDSKDENNS